MRIAVDLDNVVFEWTDAFINYTNIRFGHTDKNCEIKQWDFYNQDNIQLNEDEFNTAFDDFSRYRMWQGLTLTPGAREALCAIDSMGHQIFYLTSRPRSESMATVKSIIHNGLPFHGILFLDEKADIAKALNISMGIDDNPIQLENYMKNGIYPVLYRKTSNEVWRCSKGTEANCCSVTSLLDFVKIVRNFKQ